MICPHCGKDSDLIYVFGVEITRKAAEEKLQTRIASLDSLAKRGAHSGKFPPDYELDERYDRVLQECNELEVALGY